MNAESGMAVRGPSVTLVTPYFWPDLAASVPLMTALADDLCASGHVVTVLASGRQAGLAGSAYAGAARVRRVPNPFARKPGRIAKLLDYLWFAVGASFALLFGRRSDVYFVSSTPPLMALPVGIVARLRGARVVYNLQDLFPDSAVATGVLDADSRTVAALRWLERQTYRRADVTVTLSDSFREHVLRVAPGARVEVIPNWIDSSEMRPIPHDVNEFRAAHGIDYDVTVLYAGNFGYLHNVSTLVDAAARLRGEASTGFVFVGAGRDAQEIVRRAREHRLDNCRFLPFQPYSLLPHVYSAGDIGIVLMRRGAGHSAVPSKTWNSLSCARPVIAAVEEDSTLAQMLAESGAGVVVPPEQPDALAEAISELARDPARRRAMGERGREYVLAHLGRGQATARYASVMWSAVGRGAPLEQEPARPRPCES